MLPSVHEGNSPLTTSEIPQSTAESPPSLVEGRMMRCPHCEALRDPTDERQFKRLNMAKKYKHELNVVYVCVRHTGGCGHVFSPGNPEIVAAYLAGQLVPVEYVTNNKEERR